MHCRLLFINQLITVTLLLSCSSDDQPLPVNEGEVITTMTITLLPQGGGGTPVILRTRDLDGGGPNPPVITVTGDFKANSAGVSDGDIANAGGNTDLDTFFSVSISN